MGHLDLICSPKSGLWLGRRDLRLLDFLPTGTRIGALYNLHGEKGWDSGVDYIRQPNPSTELRHNGKVSHLTDVHLVQHCLDIVHRVISFDQGLLTACCISSMIQ